MQQLGLQRRLHLADLVQHQRAAVRLLELADARRRGAGEGAALVAEQLALEELGRQRRAVHLHERPVAPRRALVDGARDQLLADAALAADQHGDVAVGDLLDDLRDAAHLLAVAPDRAVLVVAELLTELAQLRDEAILLDRVLDGDVEGNLAESLGIVRLDDVVGGAEADGLDDGRGLIAARQHDDLGFGARRLQRPQRRQAVEAGHHHVEQDDVGSFCLLHGGEHFVAAGVAARFIPAQRKERSEICSKPRIIIDDRNKRLFHLSPWRGGAARHL